MNHIQHWKLKRKDTESHMLMKLSIPWTEQNESLDFSLYIGANQDCSNPVEQPKVVFTLCYKTVTIWGVHS